jgi:hypothetical protein
MATPSLSHLRGLINRTIGPAPWYWNTFPAFLSRSGQRFIWTHHGEQGALGYVVTLGLAQEPEKPRLALNTYCRPFLIEGGNLGLWAPEGRALRVACFDPDSLKSFDLAEIAGWFKQSSDRIFAATAPFAEMEVPLDLAQGTHKVEVPAELANVEELIAPTSYKANTPDDPAFALFVLYPHAGLVEVLPQKWFTAAQYEVGPQWITRAVRDPESHRIIGECYGVGTFLLEEDGCGLERWVERK